jgi:hypothetical protein
MITPCFYLLLGLFRINICSRKWYWPIITNLIDVAVVNAWILFNMSHQTDLPQLDFRRSLAMSYLAAGEKRRDQRKRKLGHCVPIPLRSDPVGQWKKTKAFSVCNEG